LKELTDLCQALEECQILLGLQETDLEVREVILVEELEPVLHPPNGQDLLAKLDKAPARVNRIDVQRTAEAERLSCQVMRIFGALVDLGMLPIQNIPQLLKSPREVFLVVDLVL
jgi:hypothetical protein